MMEMAALLLLWHRALWATDKVSGETLGKIDAAAASRYAMNSAENDFRKDDEFREMKGLKTVFGSLGRR